MTLRPVPADVRVTIAPTANGGWGWRLVAGNGRALAVSVPRFGGADEALSGLRRLCAAPDDLVVQVTHTRSTTQWSWTAFGPGEAPVASAERPFARYGTCVSASRRFLDATRRLAGQDLSRFAPSPDGPRSS